jgi:hypothetical protein
MPVYLADFVEELRKMGESAFRWRYTSPTLVVQSFTGGLQDPAAGSTSTLVSAPSLDAAAVSRLIGRVFPLRRSPQSPPGSTISVGRTSDNDVAVPEYSISKRHCLIRVDASGAATLTDLGSTNGTTIDGAPATPKKPVALKDGTMIGLGRFGFAYHTPLGFLALVQSQR